MRKNIDFVADMPWKSSIWWFTLAGNAKKISEIQDEFLDIVKRLYKIHEEFFIPTKIKYVILSYSHDEPANKVVLCLSIFKPIDSITRTMNSDNGISINDLIMDINSIETPNGVTKSILEIELSGKVKFLLNGKDLYIDKNSPSDLYGIWYHDKVVFDECLTDPFNIRIEQTFSKGENELVTIEDAAYYDISYTTNTDIWFENTELGEANDDRLKSVFKKLNENFNVVNVHSEKEH